jgi:hypothetical protein
LAVDGKAVTLNEEMRMMTIKQIRTEANADADAILLGERFTIRTNKDSPAQRHLAELTAAEVLEAIAWHAAMSEPRGACRQRHGADPGDAGTR